MKTKYNLIFTLDYEIHGNGDGCPYGLIVEPTNRLLDLLDKYNAKLTILADVAEISKFKDYYESTGVDKFFYQQIKLQLQDAILRGHDVQLHIHSSYFKSTYNGNGWEQCWDEYNMAALPYDRINDMISSGIKLLEDIIKPVQPTYKCTVFRAANWSMMPTPSIYRALVNNGILIDTSVFKGGLQKGNVDYDYRNAYSHLLSYPASSLNINEKDNNGKLFEVPIYTEMRYFWSFITPIRIFRMIRAKFHKHKIVGRINKEDLKNNTSHLSIKSFFKKSPWKLDFNQGSGYQLINALKRIKKQTKNIDGTIDIVSIGHCKTFVNYNEKTLEKFLKWVIQQQDVQFGLFSNKTGNK